MYFEINYEIEGMIIDFRPKNTNINLQWIFVEVINQKKWFHLCFLF